MPGRKEWREPAAKPVLPLPKQEGPGRPSCFRVANRVAVAAQKATPDWPTSAEEAERIMRTPYYRLSPGEAAWRDLMAAEQSRLRALAAELAASREASERD